MALRRLVEEASANALKKGILSSIPTTTLIVHQDGIDFPVRVVSALNKKPSGGGGGGDKSDPFANPRSTELYVTDLTPTHSLLLNKFNVVPNHVLVVTNEFEKQTDPLDRSDFAAVWKAVSSLKSLGFYNCGSDSGSSQPHKHLQVIPRDLDMPLERLFEKKLQEGEPNVVSSSSNSNASKPFSFGEYPFKHAACFLNLNKNTNNIDYNNGNNNNESDDKEAVNVLESSYQTLLNSLGILHKAPDATTTDKSYNILFTEDWMFAVERSQETTDGLSLNSVAFLGTILVKTEEQLKIVNDVGPLTILQRVSAPR